MKREFKLYLSDIIRATDKIKCYTRNLNIKDFKKSDMAIDATTRNLEIIGEAISQMQEEKKTEYSGVPWQEVKNFRNVVIHKYHSVDVDILWDIIKTKLGPLKQQIQDILEKESNKDEEKNEDNNTN